MRFLYQPSINRLLRSVFRPFAGSIPEKYHFPVTGKFSLNLPGGKTLILNSNPTCYIAKVLFWQGYKGFEYGQFKIFIELVQTSDVFLDVGANIGYYSLLASAYNPQISVYAFEPLPNAVKYIEMNVADNGFSKLIVEQVALSDEDGEATFFVSRNPKFSFVPDQLTSTGSLDQNQGSRTSLIDEIRVTTMRLDSWVEKNSISRIDLLKLDTEATEHIVLAGAHNVLAEHRPLIFCEVLPGRIEDELNSIFSEFGYLRFRIGRGGLEEVSQLRHDQSDSNDHLMVPSSDRHRIERFL